MERETDPTGDRRVADQRSEYKTIWYEANFILSWLTSSHIIHYHQMKPYHLRFLSLYNGFSLSILFIICLKGFIILSGSISCFPESLSLFLDCFPSYPLRSWWWGNNQWPTVSVLFILCQLIIWFNPCHFHS